jgi:DNA polymerase I
MRLVFDIETDGLLHELTKIHCICWYDLDNPEWGVKAAHGDALDDCLAELERADELIGHNILKFDIPALRKVYPDFAPTGKLTDTMVMSRVMYPNLDERDYAKLKRNSKYIPMNLVGRHSLAAWGQRMGFPKDDYSQRMKERGLDPWASWNQEMEDYCVIDVEVTTKLHGRLAGNPVAGKHVVPLEHAVQLIVARQEQRGFAFDEQAAGKLYAHLVSRREALTSVLKAEFGSWFISRGEFTPKRPNKRMGYLPGSTFTKLELVEFNPSSHDHIARGLQAKYGWKPKEYTDGGKPQVSEEVLSALDYPPVKDLQEYLVVQKLIGQLAEGNKAWLKLSKKGRLHGSVNTNGAVTGRMTHSDPNLAQVPRVGNPFGHECRALFIPGLGYVLVGCDAEGLELRALGHYMARFDDGEFARAVVEGKKEDKTDAHSLNQRAIGLRSRDSAKTWIYAYIYGAGAWKLGLIVWEDLPADERPRKTDKTLIRLGKHAIASIEKNLPALGKLKKAVSEAVKQRGYLIGLDGRRLFIRSEHSALNTLLQSAGAVVMKQALVMLDDMLVQAGLKTGDDYEFVANVHDEWQIEVRDEHAEAVGKMAAKAIMLAGVSFQLRCPLAGSYGIGKSWADTH